jgi:uncharacterized protein (TIGR02996 family)
MTPDETFLQAIIENPKDESSRLVYADWLEERGDPRARLVRTYPGLGWLLARLRTAAKAPFGLLDRHAADGQTDFLLGLALVLQGSRRLLHNRALPKVLDSTLDHIANLLAQGPGSTAKLEALLTILRARNQLPAQSPNFASRLAAYQQEAVLVSLFEQHAEDESVGELLACLTQEMVLRGREVRRLPVLAQFGEKLRGLGHPLAHLPLQLTDLELRLRNYLPSYGERSVAWSSPQSHPPGEAAQPLPAHPLSGNPVAATEDTDAPSAERIAAAFQTWCERSNGYVEARTFRPARAVSAVDLSVGLLQSLGLACLQGAEAEDIRTSRVPPHQAVNILFSAAAGGGAYSSGLLGAYGRSATWRSLGGLVGATAGESIECIAALAHGCLWASFDASSEWFCDVAWDYGLLAVRPDGLSLAVLAATDED